MKNSIKKIVILSISLIIISFLVINLVGKKYTVVFDVHTNNYQLLIEEDDGKIEIINKQIKDEKIFIKVKGKKPGKVY